MKKKTFIIFIIIFFIFCFFIFFIGLNKTTDDYIPIKTLGKKIKTFEAIKLFDNQKIVSDQIFINNQIYLFNIWASWCLPCRNEHKILMVLSNNPLINIVGINYKDDPENANKFLDTMGNPYSLILKDEDGIVSIELGAYGVPETFVINKDKIILKKFIGPLNMESIKEIELLIK